MLKSLLREPLFHFLAFALAIFAVYGIAAGGEAKLDSIVVTAPKIEQMATLFAKSWRRPPTLEELKGLVDDHVKEEILVREALKLGLDKDDTIVRRRLRQKMEFMNAPNVDELTPTAAELEAYLKANPATFEIEPLLAFQQIFLNPQQHGDAIEQNASGIIQVLMSQPAADYASFGDPSLLPSELPLAGKTRIGEIFGADFAELLDKATPGQWTGPVTSGFGLHLIRVSERVPGRAPALDEVRDAVTGEWTTAKRKDIEDRQFGELMKRYTVSFESATVTEASP
ncbi:peptidyl-prolyl cis-trans isomerase [Mesorhizobium muleiense]|uniref:peptidylprolyl isomerase n=1 Tax=Mesorhizobium muleiense TaxID=1004279 RepID=UPI003AFA1D32